MPVEMHIDFGEESDNADVQEDMQKARLFVSFAQKFKMTVIQNDNPIGPKFLAIGANVVLSIWGNREKNDPAIHHIESELSPLRVKLEWSGKEGDIRIEWNRRMDSDIRDIMYALREVAYMLHGHRNMICPDCNRKVILGIDTRWCPYCRKELLRKKDSPELGICVECEQDSQETNIYHHTYHFCPKCGKPLQRVRNHYSDDLPMAEEQELLGDGMPLSMLGINSDCIPKKE